MAASLGSMLPNFGGVGAIVLWGLLALVIGLILGGAVYLMIIKSARKKIIEINLVTRRITNLVAVEKRNRSHKKQLYIPKFKKFIPNIQQDDLYNQGGKDVVILVKDNNGLHHTARLPTIHELLNVYKKIYGIDLTDVVEEIKKSESSEEKQVVFNRLKSRVKGAEYKKALDLIGTIYLLPNPLENIEWLADEQNQAVQTFSPGLLNKPIVLFVSTMLVCGIVFVISMVITKLM